MKYKIYERNGVKNKSTKHNDSMMQSMSVASGTDIKAVLLLTSSSSVVVISLFIVHMSLFTHTPLRLFNQLPDSFHQPRQSCVDSVIHLSTHLCHHPHSHHPSLLQSFTPGSKPTILPTLIDFLYPLICRHGSLDWTGLMLNGLVF